MAWAEKLPSGRYRGVYRDGHGKKRSAGTFARKSEAERQAAAKEATERLAPAPVDAHTLTWGQWEERWLATRIVANSTSRSDSGRLRDHVRPQWENTLLRAITPDEVQRWVAELTASGLAPSTVTKCFRLLSNSMKLAHQARLINDNPCRGVSLPKSGPTPDRYLTDSEVAAIFASLDDFDRLLVEVLLGTGMRLGEAMGLHWESVDLPCGLIAVEWAYDPVAQIMKPPKSYQRRTLPIGKTLGALLTNASRNAGVSQSAPPLVEYPKGTRVRSGLVLAQAGTGRPFDPSNLRHRFTASARIAHVGTGKHRRPVGHVRLHDLRHTYASRLIEAGIPINEVARLLGHRSVTTTERYAHRAKDQWNRVRAALG